MNLNINIKGFNNGIRLYDKTFQVDHTEPFKFEANFIGIDKLVFESFGGTNMGLGGCGSHFAMDDFMYNKSTETAPVPEPSTMFLFGLGVLFFAALKRNLKVS